MAQSHYSWCSCCCCFLLWLFACFHELSIYQRWQSLSGDTECGRVRENDFITILNRKFIACHAVTMSLSPLYAYRHTQHANIDLVLYTPLVAFHKRRTSVMGSKGHLLVSLSWWFTDLRLLKWNDSHAKFYTFVYVCVGISFGKNPFSEQGNSLVSQAIKKS